MSGANSAANGASLEDCYTNLFALADLNGIKWKAYKAVDPAVPVGPLEDPVLSSYSKCLQASILSVWRRVRHDESLSVLDGNMSSGGSPQWAKELWIYWYGEDPKFDELITYPELKELCQGSWENSLSYECRTLLFKSLHNLIERRLLTQNFVRLGKWFVKPYPEFPINGENYSDHLSFKLSFFLHGESTACASVEVSQHLPVTKLTPEHLAYAEATANGFSNGFQVILAPYGLSAVLYGQSNKGNSEQSQKAWQVLLEWSHFYPIKNPQSTTLSPYGGESEDNEGTMPLAVEVFVGGVKMLYPSCYVFVVQDDVSNMMVQQQQQHQQQQQQQQANPAVLSPMPMAANLNVLSPMPMAATPGQSYPNTTQGNTSTCSAPNSPPDSVYPTADPSSSYPQRTMVDACVGTASDMDTTNITHQLTQKVWKEWLTEADRHLSRASAPKQPSENPSVVDSVDSNKPVNSDEVMVPPSGSSEVKAESNTAPSMWSFSDPSAKADCKCYRQKFLKSKQTVPFGKTPPGPGSNHMSSSLGSNSHGPSSKHKPDPRTEKSAKNSKYTVPFHIRTSMIEDYMYDTTDISNERIPVSVSAATPGTPGMNTNMNGVLQDLKGAGGTLARFPQPSPMQRTPGSAEPPQANESPPSNTPSPLNPPPNGILGNPMEQSMPTLSPYPPPRSSTDSIGGMGSISSLAFRTSDLVHGAVMDFHTKSEPKPIPVGEVSVPKEEEEDDLWSCFELPSVEGGGENKRPRLPSLPHSKEDLQESSLDNLYEHDNSGERFSQPHKKLRQERRTRSTLDSNVFNLQNDVDNMQRVKTPDFDPYEFKDQSPPEGGSSSIARKGSKDGKGKPRGSQQRRNSVKNKEKKRQEEEVQRRAEEEKARQEALLTTNVPYHDFGVPPIQRQEPSSLTQEQDLQLTLNDFESLFESSDEEEGTNYPNVPPDFPHSEERSSTLLVFGSSLTSSTTPGPLSGGDLGRMYPTPPSEEQTPFSPVNHPCPELSSSVANYGSSQIGKDSVSGTMHEQFEIEVEENLCSPRPEPLMDLSFVYQVPPVEKIVGPTMYAPLKSLPSSRCPPLKVPEYCIYKPSWQLPLSPKPELIPMIKESTIPMVPSVEMDLPASNQPSGLTPAGIMASPAMYPGSQEPRSAANPDPSPAPSEASSSKNLNSIEPPSSAALCPESHSLYTILGLSDSHLNMFKDCNFDSAVICACNMDIKGADVTEVRDFLIPCNCGFSAVMNRRYAVGSGLFSEDESEITGQRTDAPQWAYHKDNPHLTDSFNQKQLIPRLQSSFKDGAEDLHRTSKIVLKLIQDQCHSPYSSLQNLLSVVRQRSEYIVGQLARSQLEFVDACDACVAAIENGRQLTDSAGRGAWDSQYLRHRCLHPWAYNPGFSRGPLSSQDIVQVLRSLQPLLHDAIQKKRTKKLWERPYKVQGPLTWQVFFNIAIKGSSESPEPLPVPPLLVGYEKDWMSSSPYAVLYWEKLLLEPFSSSRDIAYIALVPDQEFICKCAKMFFKELTSVYESCNLGRHVPMAKSMRNGILRIGQKYANKVESEQVDGWFSDISELPEASKIKVFAQVCKAYVAPYLMKDPPDVSMFAQPAKMDRAYATQGMSVTQNSTTMGGFQSGTGSVANGVTDLTGGTTKGTMAAPTSLGVTPSDPTITSNESKEESSPEIAAHADFVQPPGVVIYVVDPFTYKEDEHPDYAGVSTLGLLRCFAEIIDSLSEKLVKNIAFQIIPLHQVLQVANSDTGVRQLSQLKSLAFSVFSQCHQTVNPSLPGRSLTGFGPAAELDKVIKSKEDASVHPNQVFSPPYILAPLKDKQTELGESFGGMREACGELFCTYCLSHDQKFLLTACTDNKGELNETAIINIDIPNSKRRKKVTVNNRALLKLWEFLRGVMSKSALPWRLVIGRFGRLGQGEVRDWSALLSRRSLTAESLKLKELCNMCSVPGSKEYPCILSACLVSLEPETGLRIMADSVAADKCSKSSQREQASCQLHTPDDATCTHIMVFPTSATKQDASVNYPPDPWSMDLPFPTQVDNVHLEDDILNTSDIAGLFDLTGVDDARSPTQLDQPLPGSPTALIMNNNSAENGFKHSGALPENVLPVEAENVLQQPLALGYFVSTAKADNLPKWFWSPCPEAESNCPVFLKAALHVRNGLVQQTSDDICQTPHTHPLDSNLTTDVLRYVLETYNGLSWLTVDPATGDRRSCLPVHMVVLMQLYNTVAALL